MKPCPRSLFEPIKRFLQAANMRWMGGVNKTRRLLTINCFLKMPMEECILDIHLVDGPRVHRGNAEDQTNGGRLDYGTECLAVVHAMLLSETTNHPPSFVPRERAIRVEFVPKNPLPRHHVDTCRTRN
jgi:hypothetical protein